MRNRLPDSRRRGAVCTGETLLFCAGCWLGWTGALGIGIARGRSEGGGDGWGPDEMGAAPARGRRPAVLGSRG